MIKLDIKENQFVWYESGEYYGIIKNVRSDEDDPSELKYDMIMLHNGKPYNDISSHSAVTSELEVVPKMKVLTSLRNDMANAYKEIGNYHHQIAIIMNILDTLDKLK